MNDNTWTSEPSDPSILSEDPPTVTYSFHGETDDGRQTSTLLESVLSKMNPHQRRYLLKSPSSSRIFYANQKPCCDEPLSVKLSVRACQNLYEMLTSEELTCYGTCRLKECPRGVEFHAVLKADLDEGVRLYGPSEYWYGKLSAYNGIPLSIETSQFRIDAELKFRNTKEDYYLFVKTIRPRKKEGFRKFACNIKTTWEVRNPDDGRVTPVDAEVVQALVQRVETNRHSSIFLQKIGAHADQLKLMIDLVKMASIYPYEYSQVHVENDGSESYAFTIQGPADAINKMERAYVFEPSRTIAPDPDQQMPTYGIPDIDFPISEIEKIRVEDDTYIFKCINNDPPLSEGRLMDTGTASQLKKQMKAVHELRYPNNKVHIEYLGRLLANFDSISLSPIEWVKEEFPFIDPNLDPRQQEAVQKALATPDFCLIQGPPGTGKTRVIAEIVQQEARRGKRILLVGPTHVAVDNVLERIGLRDDVSPIRCVSKKQRKELSDAIRQFTSEERTELITTTALHRVKDDLQLLQDKIGRHLQGLTDLERMKTLRPQRAKLRRREQEFITQGEQILAKVRAQYSDTLGETQAAIQNCEYRVAVIRNEIAKAQNGQRKVQQRIDDIEEDRYRPEDKSQFRNTAAKVRRKSRPGANKLRNEQIKGQAEINALTESRLQAEKQFEHFGNILSELAAGRTLPETAHSIEQKVAPLTHRYRLSIAELGLQIKATQDRRDKLFLVYQDAQKRLADLIEEWKMIREFRRNWALRNFFSRLWWKPLFTNYFRLLLGQHRLVKNHTAVLGIYEKQHLENQTALHKLISESTQEIERQKEADRRRLIKHYETQHQGYGTALEAITAQLLQLVTDQKVREQAIAHVEATLQEDLQLAKSSVKADLRREANQALADARRQVETVGTELKVRKEALMQIWERSSALEQEITKAVTGRQREHETTLADLRLHIQSTETELHELAEGVENVVDTLGLRGRTKSPATLDVFREHLGPLQERRNFLISWSRFLEEKKNRDNLTHRFIKCVNLVCATTVGIATDTTFGDKGSSEEKEFDLLIVDEAGKVTEPEFLVAAVRARKWILVGDHKQLPPYFDAKVEPILQDVRAEQEKRQGISIDDSLLNTSLLERWWEKLETNLLQSVCVPRYTSLTIQRRMHPDLAGFISEMFYNHEYHSPDEPGYPESRTLLLADFKRPITFIEVTPPRRGQALEIDLRSGLDREDLKISRATGYANFREADQVLKVVHALIKDPAIQEEQDQWGDGAEKPPVIGIIAFYLGQVQLIRHLLEKQESFKVEKRTAALFVCDDRIWLEVNTVDAFQGKECPVILLSFTRSNPGRRIGFVDNPNRLNVAMSRARKNLILLGDPWTFNLQAQFKANPVGTKTDREEIHFFTELMKYIQGRGHYYQAFEVKKVLP